MSKLPSAETAKVFWLNYRYGGNGYPYSRYYAAHNAALEAAKVRFPNLVVLDWHGYSMSQSPATQADWFSSDQIHITSSGAFALAHYIRGRVDAEHVERCVGQLRTREPARCLIPQLPRPRRRHPLAHRPSLPSSAISRPSRSMRCHSAPVISAHGSSQAPP